MTDGTTSTFTVYNGEEQDISGKADKVTATNLLTNGDFSNSTVGWSTSTLASCTVSDNVAICLANSANDSINKTLSTVADHKYYFAARVKSTSNLIRFYLSNAQRYHSGSGNYELLSSIFTATSTNHGMGVLDSRLSGFDNFYVKYAIAIDLTATFGAGNEPTAAGMDALLSAFPNSWFDGTQWLPYAGAETRLETAITNYHNRTGETDDEEVVFSVSLNTIKKYDVIKDKSNYRNFAVVAGEGEGSARVFEIVDISAPGEQKRHLWVDARDLQQEEGESIADYRLKLRQRGLEKLAETVEIDNVEIEIEDNEAQKIGVDYDIGDVVWVIVNPLQMAYKMKIIEVEDVVNQGKRSTSLIFGNKIPTAWEKVKRLYK